MAQVMKLEPGDILVLANVGDVLSDGQTLDVLGEALRSFGLDQVLVFEGDVDLSKVRGDAVAGG